VPESTTISLAPESTTLAPAPVPAPVPIPSLPRPSALPDVQRKFALKVVRNLKKAKDAPPFLRPVDPIALNIPHYFNVVKNPMDLGTVEKKLTTQGAYGLIQEFIDDVRLVFNNCYTFNGPTNPVSEMGKRLEANFDKQIKGMPPVPQVNLVLVWFPGSCPSLHRGLNVLCLCLKSQSHR
jgi:hypothetical protein